MPEIAVTGAELANGLPWPSGNPVARAVRRALPDAWWVTAGLESVTVTDRAGTREHRLPAKVSAALAAWYDGTWRTPFRFTLPDSPEQSGRAA